MRTRLGWSAVAIALSVFGAKDRAWGASADAAADILDAGAQDAPGDGGAFSSQDAAPRNQATNGANRPPEPLAPIVPAYPDAAMRAGVAGTVSLILTIEVDGAVSNVEVEAGLGGGLTEAATAAARAARFRPATDGEGH